ncbi:MAG: leucine-rich repeat protein [Lachnospiraceae bacterium]|nr:leucine-rich repeat protein [Lachnospiraceae bacterium]
MEKLLSWLIDSSIIAGFIILIVLAIRPFIKKLPKWVNLILWLIVAVRLVMPFGLQSSFSLVPDIAGIRSGYSKILFGEQEDPATDAPEIDTVRQAESADTDEGDVSENYSLIEENTPHPVAAQPPSPRQGRHQATTWLDISPQGEGFKGESVFINTESDDNTDIAISPIVEADQNLGIGHILLIIWLSGCILMLAYFVFSIIRIKRKVRFSVAANVPDDIRKESLAPVYVCEAIKTPFIMGLFGTKLYIPEGMDSSSLMYVIKHENAHITHFDQIWKVLGFILLMLYWFNPLVWIGFIFFSKDIELACDERAAGRLSATDRAAYSEALLKCSVHNRMLAACPVAFGEVGVKERIKAVISIKKPVKAVIAVLILSCIVFAFCFLTNPVSAKNKDKSESTRLETEHSDNPEMIGGSDVFTNNNENADTDKNAYSTEKNGIDEKTDDIKKTASAEKTDKPVNSGISDNSDNTRKNEAETDTAKNNDNTDSKNTSEESSAGSEKIDRTDNMSTEPVDDSKVPSEENAIIPQGIKKIKDNAFADTKTIKNVTLPDSVETIGRCAFNECMELESVNIPSSVKTIGANAFAGCTGLLKVLFSEGVTDIGAAAFYRCGLIRVTLPDSVKSIGEGIFSENRRLKYCKLPKGITAIPDRAFSYCTVLEELEIPVTVSKIGVGAFGFSGLKEIRIPEGVTVIEASAFAGCSELERVYLPDSLISIKEAAFYNCPNLVEINIPDSVTEIADNAFKKCGNLPESVKKDIRAARKRG